jgi:hypothetical protein
MPRIDVSKHKFDFKVQGGELRGRKEIRLPICSIAFPAVVQPNQILDTGIVSGFLGDISIETEEFVSGYVLPSAVVYDAGQTDTGIDPVVVPSDSSESFVVQNRLVVESRRFETAQSTFRPCYLDRNKDGVVSARDVDAVYENIPFIDPKYDINNDGIVNSSDYNLAREYIGTICEGTPPPPPDPTGVVLHLDCFTYNQGDYYWRDSSQYKYDFRIAGNSVDPIKNEDGGITLGYGALTGEDAPGTRRYFIRTDVVKYPPGTEFTNANIAAFTADAAAVERELFMPDIDQAFSFEFVFRFTPFLNHGQDVAGISGPAEVGEQFRRCKIFGNAEHGYGGFNFGTFYTPTPYAYDTNVFIPYHGLDCGIYGGEGAGTQPGTWNGQTGYPHPSEYPNLLPYSKLSSNRYEGRSASSGNTSLNLDPVFGFPTSLDKFYVTVSFDPYAGANKGSKLYVNGQLVSEEWARGIGVHPVNDAFLIGNNMQGGWSSPDGVDVYCLKIYNEALDDEEVYARYQSLLNKYGQ